MKLTEIKTWVVGNPTPDLGGRYFIFVRLTCSNDLVGYGEIYAATFGPARIAELACDVFARHLCGRSPFDIEAMWRAVYGSGYSLRPDITLCGVLSGLEIACWDLIGKALDQPVHRLLGGCVQPRLRTYTYLYPSPKDQAPVYSDPDTAAERACEYVKAGFTAVKFDPAGPYSVYDGRQPNQGEIMRSEKFMQKLREAVGGDADLLFGTHGQFTAAGAKRLARRLEPYDPLWFEEPVPPDNPNALAEVARATTIPIASGERLATKHEFARLLEVGAVSILQMALGRVGGLLEAKKIAGMGEAFSAQIAPHLYCGPIEGAANIQLAACSPNFLILESIYDWGGFYAELLHQPIRWADGYVEVPEAPGLGVELNEVVAEKHPYTGDALHLEMQTEPVLPS